MSKKLKPKTIRGLVGLYEISNQAEGKSPKTISWYTEIIGAFLLYLESRKDTLHKIRREYGITITNTN